MAAEPITVFRPLVGGDRYARLQAAADATRARLAGHVIWNVNSTASGGGVAEMLRVLVGYVLGTGVDARWVVIDGDPTFFAITKRIHNRLHGVEGDNGATRSSRSGPLRGRHCDNAVALLERVRTGDVVLLHDPQTAGMAPVLADVGVKVIWRCHIGSDHVNASTEEAWEFLRPHLSSCDAFVFSRRAYAPTWVPEERLSIIAPSIDPFSPKNQVISDGDLPGFLTRMGLATATRFRPAGFHAQRPITGRSDPHRDHRLGGRARPRRCPRDPGVAMGPPQGHAWSDGRFRSSGGGPSGQARRAACPRGPVRRGSRGRSRGCGGARRVHR